MFAPISAVLGVFLFASTLPNGIRVDELPASAGSVEIVAGYGSGGLSGFESTAAARALLIDAYAAGADIQFISEMDRTALRISAPAWAAPMLFPHLDALFKEAPMESDPMAPSPQDFRAKVEEEIREALLGASDAEPDYATADAFVLSSVPPPKSVLDALAAIPRRGSPNRVQDQSKRLVAERTLRFQSELPAGAVIFAAPAPAVYYKEWYLLLLLDKLIHRTVSLPLKTAMPLNVRTYYYRIELPLNPGQFPEPAEENLLQELQRLQFVQASPQNLTAARQDAIAYLDSSDVREWFASHGIADRRDEGVQWIQSMTSDDLRAAARDLLLMNRVVATWAPKPKETSVSIEPLSSGQSSQPANAAKRAPNEKGPKPSPDIQVSMTAFPPHMDPPASSPVPEKLSSGVSIVPSDTYAVFVSGGALTRIAHDPVSDDMKSFSMFRADRILVLSPPALLDAARQVWSAFKGNAAGLPGVPKGKVSTGDLPGLFLLKTMLDLKIIESGWWSDVQLRIDASAGSSLQIVSDDAKRAQILDWIKAIAMNAPSEKYFNWAREVAVHRFRIAEPDLQALTWERDPQGMILDLSAVSSGLLQDVARIYF